MLTFREYSAAGRIHRMFIRSDKNALSPLAKNVQTTRSKFASGRRCRAEGIPRRKGSGEREREKGSLRRGKKNLPIELYSAAKRQMEDGERRGAREGTRRDGMNSCRSVVRGDRVHCVPCRCILAGFNIKRFYEPNKKAINRFRLDRRGG